MRRICMTCWWRIRGSHSDLMMGFALLTHPTAYTMRRHKHHANGQKFFGSFFQKRTASFPTLPSYSKPDP